MIIVEVKQPQQGQSAEEIEIILDADGLRSLLSQLQFLTDGRTDHIHFMSPAWGGVELGDEPLNEGATTIHHLKLQLR
jgi:Immunity protein 32